jgi:hypothetical protein
MSTIIALRGRPKCGKTSALKLVFEKMAPNKSYKLLKQSGRADIYAILMKDGKKIELSTAGDIRHWIKRWLEDFQEQNCKIIVIACHLGGPTVEEIERMRDLGYGIIYVEKTLGTANAEMIKTNQNDANKIFQKVEKLLK